jgi:hypothetical protein
MRLMLAFLVLFLSTAALAKTEFGPRLTDGNVVLGDFRFRSGEIVPEPGTKAFTRRRG